MWRYHVVATRETYRSGSISIRVPKTNLMTPQQQLQHKRKTNVKHKCETHAGHPRANFITKPRCKTCVGSQHFFFMCFAFLQNKNTGHTKNKCCPWLPTNYKVCCCFRHNHAIMLSTNLCNVCWCKFNWGSKRTGGYRRNLALSTYGKRWALTWSRASSVRTSNTPWTFRHY